MDSPLPVALRMTLPHGRCVGITIPESLPAPAIEFFPEAERTLMTAQPPPRRASFAAGRTALRGAIEDLGILVDEILINDRGAPSLPPDICGSISHKRNFVVGLACRPSDHGAEPGEIFLGVDLEWDAPLKVDISRRVLTGEETAALRDLPESDRNREILMRVSAKEAIYKALDPFVRRFVSFREASIRTFEKDGTAEATLRLPSDEGPFAVAVRWTRIEPNYILTTALVRRA